MMKRNKSLDLYVVFIIHYNYYTYIHYYLHFLLYTSTVRGVESKRVYVQFEL